MSAAQALDNDEYYAMLDSGTNAIIVPLHPRMEGEVAECQVPGTKHHSAHATNPEKPFSAQSSRNLDFRSIHIDQPHASTPQPSARPSWGS